MHGLIYECLEMDKNLFVHEEEDALAILCI